MCEFVLEIEQCKCFCSQLVEAGAHVLLMQVYENIEVKKRIANTKLYGKWLEEGSQRLELVNFNNFTLYNSNSLLKYQ
jgi:hypothetical protein